MHSTVGAGTDPVSQDGSSHRQSAALWLVGGLALCGLETFMNYQCTFKTALSSYWLSI